MYLSVETRILEGTPYHMIVEKTKNTDLIVMEHTGKTKLKKILTEASRNTTT